ncbi:MAG: DUF4239 domain-containing protein [Cyanobacteria bacterium SZAS LIN-3]|nr:DUF4239 domain-containing protein [Cyanobacteria bacterium SZAS LIN-3]
MSIDSYPIGATVIVGVTLLSVAGLLFVRKQFSLEELRKGHEVGGYLLSVVGTMYAVLLGLVVVDSMTKFQQARNIVESEANSLADVFMLADRLPPDKAKAIHELCNFYCNDLLTKEWPAMAKGEITMSARKAAIKLIREVSDFEPTTENQKAIYPILVQETCQVWDSRRARTNISGYGVPGVEWTVLIIGGIVTVVFTYFFGLENAKAQITMTAMVSLLISLNLYLVVLFGAPFSGDLSVGEDAFKLDKRIFENELGYRHDPDYQPSSYGLPGPKAPAGKATIGLLNKLKSVQ